MKYTNLDNIYGNLNKALEGSIIYLKNCQDNIFIQNSVFYDNEAIGSGGAIYS